MLFPYLWYVDYISTYCSFIVTWCSFGLNFLGWHPSQESQMFLLLSISASLTMKLCKLLVKWRQRFDIPNRTPGAWPLQHLLLLQWNQLFSKFAASVHSRENARDVPLTTMLSIKFCHYHWGPDRRAFWWSFFWCKGYLIGSLQVPSRNCHSQGTWKQCRWCYPSHHFFFFFSSKHCINIIDRL